jgi:hypothetical protein
MVDLPKLKKNVLGEAQGMPAPPVPAYDMDLPAPAPPMQKPQGIQIPNVPRPQQASPPPGISAVKPLRLPEVRKRAIEEGLDNMAIHGSPPVFIKIDKYSDVVRNLQRLKTYALSLRDALDALSDIEKEITTGISLAHKALDDFNSTIAVLDSKLLRASAIEDMDVDKPEDVDRYIKGIYEQMEKIKAELNLMA